LHSQAGRDFELSDALSRCEAGGSSSGEGEKRTDSSAESSAARAPRLRVSSLNGASVPYVWERYDVPMKLKPGPMYEEIFGVKEAGQPAARSAVTLVPKSANPAKETKSCTRPSESADIESADFERESDAEAAPWVVKVLTFLEHNGQALLSSICAHYRIEFDGDLASVGRHSRDQLVHSCIFNPALAKSKTGWLPKMLRDISSVTDWHMTFLKNDAGIYRSVRVAARLNGEDLAAQCRCCSYCGSCFSGRFMKDDIVHQQDGGWKEINKRTAAGQHSWSSLRGWRLCVPCFSHWSSKGTHANRKSIDELMRLHKDFITSEPSHESSHSLSSELAVVHPELDVPCTVTGGRDANQSEERLSLQEADGSDTSGEDSLLDAERWPSPNPDSSHVTHSSSTPTPSQADAVARDKDADLEDLALKQHSLQVEDAAHVLLSISTSLALNDAAHDLLSIRQTAKERMRQVGSTIERASTPDTKPKKQHEVCARCFQVCKSPHALHGHMKHCNQKTKLSQTLGALSEYKNPVERADGGAGSGELANGTRKRLPQIEWQGMSKDERAKWCLDPPVPKGKKKRKASPVASARTEWQEGSAMQTAMQAAPFERDPNAQKRQESPSSRCAERRHGALDVDVREGDVEGWKPFYEHLVNLDRVDVQEGGMERVKSPQPAGSPRCWRPGLLERVRTEHWGANCGSSGPGGTANVSSRFAAAVAGRWPEVAASPLPRFSPITPEVGRGSRGEARKRFTVDRLQQTQTKPRDKRPVAKRISAPTPQLSPAARAQIRASLPQHLSGNRLRGGIVKVRGGKKPFAATENAYREGIGKEKRVSRCVCVCVGVHVRLCVPV
jgi:hypothetical protein